MSKKRILVTGGFGFIGGHLIEHFLLPDKGNSVHVVDDLSSSPVPLRLLLDEIRYPPNLSYDICTIAQFCRDHPDYGCDEIYHLASPVGPAGVLKYAGIMTKMIIDDTYLMMDLALANKARLVDVSTSEVYGGGREGYCSEDYSKIVPAKTTVRLEYATGKLAAETAIINRCRVTELQACIVRPFNIAGPRQSGVGGFVLPRFVALAMQNRPITVFGDGKQVRAFTYVRDICDGLVKAMQLGKVGEAYNLGNPLNKISILELAEMVLEVVNSRSTIICVDPKTIYGSLYEEASDKYPDAQKAMTELQWKPTLDVSAIIHDVYSYMRTVSRDLFVSLSGLDQ